MNSSYRPQRTGLILLVVLGMLALFSMLAVTYVVFASQSRATSVSLSRKDVRGNKSYKPLFDEAIKQLIRGTTDNTVATYGHSLLGDIYGDRESVVNLPAATTPAARQAALLTIRDYETLNQANLARAPMTYNSLQRPMLLGPSLTSGVVNGHYLRIPLDPGVYGNPDPNNYVSPQNLPMEHDVLNGRVVTFPQGNGPLSGQSFRILRYIGRIPPGSDPNLFAQNYSITIDLLEADLTQTYAKFDAGLQQLKSLSVAEWINAFPPPGNQSHAGVYACYGVVDDSAARLLTAPFNVLLNAAPLNSHGVGVLNDGSSQIHILSNNGTPIENVATGLLPNYRMAEVMGEMRAAGAQTASLLGDTDEPYDAPDGSNFFLAHRYSNATTPGEIIPSFHRAALINYFVNWKNPQNYTEQDLLNTIRRIQAATARPLNINVLTPAGSIVNQVSFTGSNNGASSGGNSFTPTLTIQIPNNWSGNWPTAGLPAFLSWVNWLTAGPWDVDNDADGVTDSLWVDAGLPLQTSADGQLLKAMVAYYVEDLDNKLDVNATASYAQTGANPPYINNIGYTAQPDGEFARAVFNNGNNNSPYLTQGLGYGAAETSFRHLFARTFGNTPQANLAFQQFLMARYGRNSQTLDRFPGLGPISNNPAEGDDAISQLRLREQRNVWSYATLPGLPMGTHGRATVALDRLGNPRVMNVDNVWAQGYDEPYESRWLSAPFQDSPITLADWERIYRIGDGDRTALPQRLENLFGETSSTISSSNLRHEITPRSSHLRAPTLATRGLVNTGNDNIPHNDLSWQPSSFIELINTIIKSRDPSAAPIQLYSDISYRGFVSLFPLEFQRGLPMDLNRPFGNGADDNDTANGYLANGEIDEPMELFRVNGGNQPTQFPTGQRSVGPVGVNEDYLQGQLQVVPAAPPNDHKLFDPHIVYSGGTATPPIFRHNLESRQLFARHLYCLAQLIIPQNYKFPNSDPSATFTEPIERARILAQWAVNIVDFRDSDSSMTRFPYDPAPFTPKTDSNGQTYYAWQPAPQAVVWGMEQPELLITESLATHDVRIKRDTSSPTPRYDQYRIPEGSLFLELFCPRMTVRNANNINTSAAGVSPALYATSGANFNINNQVALDLTRLAPAGPNGVGEVPVWRVYISGPTPVQGNPPSPPTDKSTPLEVYNEVDRKHLLSLQLPTSNLRYDSTGTLLPDATQNAQNSGLVLDRASAVTPIPDPDPTDARVVVFRPNFIPTVDNSPGVVDPDSQVFVNQSSDVVLMGGQYLVVGPRVETYFGSRVDAFADPTKPVNHPNPHRIFLGNDRVQTFAADNNEYPLPARYNNFMNDTVSIVAGSQRPPSWQNDPNEAKLYPFIGLNVSEPLANDTDYYKAPTTVVNPGDNQTDPQTDAPGFQNVPYWDAYSDYSQGPPVAESPFDDQETTKGPLRYWLAGNNTTITEPVVQVGTQENWCTAYLQRLADPLKPWDASFNPYITVDWMPIDLTVFSGEENHSDVYPATPPAGQEIKFASRQKTGQPLRRNNAGVFLYDPTSTEVGTTFYSSATHSPRKSVAAGGTNFFDYEMELDEVQGTAQDPIRPTQVELHPSTNVNNTFTTLGFLNSTYRIAGEEGSVATSVVRGLPADPTNNTPPPLASGAPAVTPNPNWAPDAIYWMNRPYVNPLELANVPLSSPGQFMQEFSALEPNTAARYELNDSGTLNSAFNHLLSFTFEQSARPQTPGQFIELPMSTLFNLVETASPWSDANKYADPRVVDYRDPSTAPAIMQPIVAATNAVMQPLRPPYNRISKYVEPGRVNLNTLAEPSVMQGLLFNALTPNDRAVLLPATVTDFWTQFLASRRGYTGGGGSYTPPVLPLPDGSPRFNPEVPTEFGRVFKPATEAGMVPATRTSQVLDAGAWDVPINVTLMRADPANANLPLVRDGSYPQAQKNAFTDTHPFTRMENLTSERSNVFAVYITIGFFEFDPATGQISQEYGADKGQSQRYKAFYVVDRSIPVGFQTGVDHNIEKTILQKRYLKTDDK